MTLTALQPEIVPADNQPFPVEVMVFEDDTFQVLGAGNHVREIRQPLEELQQAAVEQSPAALGDLVIRGSRWFAILHDFDRQASFSNDSVMVVLQRIAAAVEEQQITAIAMQALGSHHGPEDLVVALDRISRQVWPDCLKSIWIVPKK